MRSRGFTTFRALYGTLEERRRFGQFGQLLALFVVVCAQLPAHAESQKPRKVAFPTTPAPQNAAVDVKAIQTPAPVTEAPAVEKPIYRSLAIQAVEPSSAGAMTENRFVVETVELPEASPATPAPIAADSEFSSGMLETYSDAGHVGWWAGPTTYKILPPDLLWEPPLANQREPRMYGKFTNLNNESTIDTAIGGEFGVLRWGPADVPHEGVQIDGFAGVFTRFNEQRLLVTSDFRAGVPITYSKGPWQAKISYEHTSTHLGDEYKEATGAVQVPHVRDEIVVGLARRFWNQIRVYGQAGFSFATSNVVGENRDRYDTGIEWSKQCATGWKGQPFAALDVDIRSDQDYEGNLTLQIGWQWKEMPHRRSARMGFEAYNGRSPYGQFFRDREDWIGFVALYDF